MFLWKTFDICATFSCLDLLVLLLSQLSKVALASHVALTSMLFNPIFCLHFNRYFLKQEIILVFTLLQKKTLFLQIKISCSY